MTLRVTFIAVVVVLWMVGVAYAQSSSLYLSPAGQPVSQSDPPAVPGATPFTLSPAVSQTSLLALPAPLPRQYAVNDLVQIIIRESTEITIEASMETEKGAEFQGAIEEFPRLTLADLFDLQLVPGEFPDGPIELAVSSDQEFEGEGDYERSEEVTGRVQARVVDVKPNGTLVLEARKHITADSEELDLVLTGTCRVEDITIDNTVLSSQLYDLHLNKDHRGDLRRATRKGVLTRILEVIFNF